MEIKPTKVSILEFAGLWNDLSDEEVEKMKTRIKELRQERGRLEELHKMIAQK